MAIPRYITGRKYWFQNCWEDLQSRHTCHLKIRQILPLGLLLLVLGLVRWALRLARIFLSQEQLLTVMSYSLRNADFGLLMTVLRTDYPIISTYGSRVMKRRNRWVTERMLKSGLCVTEVVHIVQSIGDGEKE